MIAISNSFIRDQNSWMVYTIPTRLPLVGESGVTFILLYTGEISMGERDFFINYDQVIVAIEYCISQNLIAPSLILIYSSIDSLSWTATDDEDQPVGERFQSWVNNWMFQRFPLPCTALELYAARCGLLHTLTPNSSLSEKKGVRQLAYAWGTAKQEDLDKSMKPSDNKKYVAVHINDIFSSFKYGVNEYLEAIEKNVAMKELFIKKANKHFVNLAPTIIEQFLKSSDLGGISNEPR
jgi:hypothetical protein